MVHCAHEWCIEFWHVKGGVIHSPNMQDAGARQLGIGDNDKALMPSVKSEWPSAG